MAIQWSVTPHTRFEEGNLICSNYGEHIVSLDISGETSGIDNGRIVHVTGMKLGTLDLWQYEAASNQMTATVIMQHPVSKLWLVHVDSVADDKLAIIYEPPIIAEESPRALTPEKNFYNIPDDGPCRGLILHALDRFWLSEDGFSGTPAQGATIRAISNGKPVISN